MALEYRVEFSKLQNMTEIVQYAEQKDIVSFSDFSSVLGSGSGQLTVKVKTDVMIDESVRVGKIYCYDWAVSTCIYTGVVDTIEYQFSNNQNIAVVNLLWTYDVLRWSSWHNLAFNGIMFYSSMIWFDYVKNVLGIDDDDVVWWVVWYTFYQNANFTKKYNVPTNNTTGWVVAGAFGSAIDKFYPWLMIPDPSNDLVSAIYPKLDEGMKPLSVYWDKMWEQVKDWYVFYIRWDGKIVFKKREDAPLHKLVAWSNIDSILWRKKQWDIRNFHVVQSTSTIYDTWYAVPAMSWVAGDDVSISMYGRRTKFHDYNSRRDWDVIPAYIHMQEEVAKTLSPTHEIRVTVNSSYPIYNINVWDRITISNTIYDIENMQVVKLTYRYDYVELELESTKSFWQAILSLTE